MKKLFLITVLGMAVVSCSLFSPSRWAEYEKDRAGSGRRCYEKRSGYIYCEDENGNRY
nr:hypothetical protein [uncultured Leptotrichia sp.]